MPSLMQRCASRWEIAALACALVAGCGGGDLQPIQLGDGGAEAEAHRRHHDAHDASDDSGDDDDAGDDTSDDDDAGPIPRSQIQSESPRLSEEGR